MSRPFVPIRNVDDPDDEIDTFTRTDAYFKPSIYAVNAPLEEVDEEVERRRIAVEKVFE